MKNSDTSTSGSSEFSSDQDELNLKDCPVKEYSL